MRPLKEDCPEYYNYYIGLIKESTVVDALKSTKESTIALIKSINEDLADFAYAGGKWTIKQLLVHCIDTERIFSTRALCFARGETQKAISFDENSYAENSNINNRTLNDILEEFEAVRISSICLFKSLSQTTLNLKGFTPIGPATVNAIGFAICGHTEHHLNILRERYLK
jgi:hypothetical protein